MPSSQVTRALQKRSEQALAAFHSYYSAVWGELRWNESLFPALALPTRYCALVNRYSSSTDLKPLLVGSDLSVDDLQQLDLPPVCDGAVPSETFLRCFTACLPSTDIGTESLKPNSSKASFQFPPPQRAHSETDSPGLLSHWNMDAASVLAAHMLSVRPGDHVLDLCAAPGGKSVVLAQRLWPGLQDGAKVENLANAPKSCLHSNEIDATRNKRLESNLKSYLPSQLFSDDSIKILKIDVSDKRSVSQLPYGEEWYDKVLVDAPCSSERHIIQAWAKATSAGRVADEMTNWKSSHSKTLAKTQAAILMTALKAVKCGGRVVYATCSISTEENDGVVERVLESLKRERKKESENRSKRWDVQIVASEGRSDYLRNMTEPTKYGRIALPDNVTGERWGPLYFCILEKIPFKRKSKHKTAQPGMGESDED